MSDFIQPRSSESRLRAAVKYSTVGAVAVIALVGGYKFNHQPATHDTPTISLPLGSKGRALVFSESGSELEKSIQFSTYQEVESQQHATVSFDALHCEGRELHGGMFVSGGPHAAIWITDMTLPENSLSGDCEVGNELPAAHAGKLMIAGSTYRYTLGS